ncbi:hypothetical protein, partial [Brevundimonas fluminis]|uniref:hypothetical protein n=1 Tax=Brevundimonas fluminis TaxID=2487274 RepID=UPI0019D1C4F9
ATSGVIGWLLARPRMPSVPKYRLSPKGFLLSAAGAEKPCVMTFQSSRLPASPIAGTLPEREGL